MDFVDHDAELMLRYASGDMAAFEALYTRHKGPLYRYLLRRVHEPAAASDLFQEVWSRIIESRDRYATRAKFATFLFHIARRCTIDHHRRRRARPPHASAEDFAAIPSEPAGPEHERPDRLAELGEQQSALLAALAALPPEQREAFLLREEGGLAIDEIARLTSVGVETAKSRVRYAVRKLRHALRYAACALLAFAVLLSIGSEPRMRHAGDEAPRFVRTGYPTIDETAHAPGLARRAVGGAGTLYSSDPPPRTQASRTPAGPRAWLDEIGALRKAGRDTQADAEYRRFLSTYPNYAAAGR
jgi:RNA polymerase sigma-70 factor, ECF subfamily